MACAHKYNTCFLSLTYETEKINAAVSMKNSMKNGRLGEPAVSRRRYFVLWGVAKTIYNVLGGLRPL